MSDRDRSYAFFGGNRAAVAMDEHELSDGSLQLTISLAFCNHRDNFNKATARKVLDGRIDARLNGRGVRLTYQTNYNGTRPRKDVMSPIMDVLRNIPANREYEAISSVKEIIARSFQEELTV